MSPRLTCAALLLVASRLFAQFDSGQIAGFVKDPSDAVAAKASVVKGARTMASHCSGTGSLAA